MTIDAREEALSPSSPLQLNPPMQLAVEELKVIIRQRYPTATFEVTPTAEDPGSIHLIAVVDVDDPDEVGDLVVDRVVELQAEEGIPIHVIPVRIPGRIAAAQENRSQFRHTGRRTLSISNGLAQRT